VSPVRYELGFYIPEDGVLHTAVKTSTLTFSAASANVQRPTPGQSIRPSLIALHTTLLVAYWITQSTKLTACTCLGNTTE
jgi:hypothetical protein